MGTAWCGRHAEFIGGKAPPPAGLPCSRARLTTVSLGAVEKLQNRPSIAKIEQPHVEVVRGRSGRALRGVYFGTNCLAGEHVHRVWPDERGGLRARTIGAGPADGDRLQDSATISQGVCPVARLFYEPQPLPGTSPICYVAASQYPGQLKVLEFILEGIAGSP